MNLTDSFRAARWLRRINLLLQAGLFLSLFAGLNYLSVNHAWRKDLTRTHQHSLSPETISYLKGLEHDVEIVVTLTDNTGNDDIDQAYRDISSLLREYDYETAGKQVGQGRIKMEFLDVDQRRKDAALLGIDQPNQVVLICGERRRMLTIRDLYVSSRQGEQIRREAFLGESVLTAAILDVSNPTKKKIYFLAGRGELSPNDVSSAGLSLLRDELRKRDFAVEELDLATAKKIPSDASLLIAVGPQNRYRPFEEELLRSYLNKDAGRLILMFNPGLANTGLDELLLQWGILVSDNLLFDDDPNSISETGDLVLRRNNEDHPISQFLAKNQLVVFVPSARVVMPDPGRSLEEGYSVSPLIATARSAWGKTNYKKQPPTFVWGEDMRDTKNGLSVVVASEQVKPAKLALAVPGGRVVVFGSAEVVTNRRIDLHGNFNLFLNSVNWAVDRDNQLNIRARPIQRFQLSLSQEELGRLRLGLLLIVPGAAALLGLLVYWARRD